MLTIAGADPAHRGLRRYSFLIDSGTDCNLVDQATAMELLTAADLPSIGITGVTGNVIRTIGGGTLDLAFFIGGRLLSRPLGGPGATVFSMPPDARVRRGRARALTPIKDAATAHDRMNIFTTAAMVSFRGAAGHSGIRDFSVPPNASSGASIAQRARGKAPARRRELNQINATIREHIPRGYLFCATKSTAGHLQHPPDKAFATDPTVSLV